MLTLEPQALTGLTDADADTLVGVLAGATDELGVRWLVRFGPEMNGSWTRWGQQPTAYVEAFRTLADAVHDGAGQASMVWAPSYGAGYPFREAYGALEHGGGTDARRARRDVARLDTDGSGRVDAGDDPYGPYYPGDEAVDWVGLTVLRYGLAQRFDDAPVPRDGELAARLDESFGYDVQRARRSFAERFASRDRPLLLLTSARAGDGEDAPPALAVKRAWWRQVVAAARDRPALGGVVWLELTRFEAETEGPVDWSATGSERMAAALAADLRDSPFVLGGVTDPVPDPELDPVTDPSPEATGGEDATTAGGGGGDQAATFDRTAETLGMSPTAAAGVLGGLVVALVWLVAGRLRRRRMQPPWL